MKKTLIALAVLGAVGVAHAQSNVTIYGAVDINYMKETGSKVAMDERYNNRLGFMGQEALGGGLYATFQLEERFKLFNGVASKRGDFEGAANAGLKGSFGQVRFGRLNEISTETYRQIDPFQQYGVAGMYETPLRGEDGTGRLSSTARYDSPVFNGFKVAASYTVENNQAKSGYTAASWTYGAGNAGYAVGATYDNGPLYVVANYSKLANSTDSYNWNIGAAYAFGPAKLSAGYEKTTDKENVEKIKSWILGVSYTVGAGVINASYNHSETDASVNDSDKWALGYTHNLSKRTSLYANYSSDKTEGSPSVKAYEIGVTHKF